MNLRRELKTPSFLFLSKNIIIKKMSFNKKITVLSTFTEDKVIDDINKIAKTQKGGPAFYIANVFKHEKLAFDVVKTPTVKIEIKLKKNLEIGKVKTMPKTKKVDFDKMNSEFMVISTILKEFNLSGISKYKGKVFLDIQGYVRDRKNFVGKILFHSSSEIATSIFCLKGTEEEVGYLPKDFIKTQKKKILIVTKGSKGCEAFILGKKYVIKPKRISNPKNTIGAGDTFFAHFIAYLCKDNDFVEGLRYATEKTSIFLERKV